MGKNRIEIKVGEWEMVGKSIWKGRYFIMYAGMVSKEIFSLAWFFGLQSSVNIYYPRSVDKISMPNFVTGKRKVVDHFRVISVDEKKIVLEYQN